MRATPPPRRRCKGKDFFGGKKKKKQQRKTQNDNRKDMASITSSGWVERVGRGASARCGKKEKCQFKYKTAIMLLHIHKVLLRAYHSMQSTLPCHHGSRGALQQQWGGRKLHMGMEGEKKRENK